MTYKSISVSQVAVKREVVHSKKRDNHQRIIGIAFCTHECLMEPMGRRVRSVFYNLKPGHYFALRVQPTRSGTDFGAKQKIEFFETEEARTAKIESRLKTFWANIEKENK
jgi:hypothetical protein